MIIKSADNKSESLAILEQLLNHPSITDKQRKSIEQELRLSKAGLKAESDAAYLIDFDFKDTKNYAVIHDLRLELNGRVAQIDHLIINRTLDVFVLETKSFHSGLKINEKGEFLRWNDYKKTFEGMSSPIEQNQRHIKVLAAAFEQIELPRRLGFRLVPKLTSVILISPNARIDRPHIFDTSSVIKADSLKRYIMDTYDDPIVDMVKSPVKTSVNTLSSVVRIVAPNTIEDLANKLVALHKPLEIDYKAKFGIQDCPKLQHVCRQCNSTEMSVLYGKYGYYFKCHTCDANTAIKPKCSKEKCVARIRKEGEKFFHECVECQSSKLYFTNLPIQVTTP